MIYVLICLEFNSNLIVEAFHVNCTTCNLDENIKLCDSFRVRLCIRCRRMFSHSFVALYVRTIDHNQLVTLTEKENLSLEVNSSPESVLLTNPLSERHGWSVCSCLEKKLNGQVQPRSANVQLAALRFSFSLFVLSPYSLK